LYTEFLVKIVMHPMSSRRTTKNENNGAKIIFTGFTGTLPPILLYPNTDCNSSMNLIGIM